MHRNLPSVGVHVVGVNINTWGDSEAHECEALGGEAVCRAIKGGFVSTKILQWFKNSLEN
jgi:hypothetical protein